MFRSTLTLLALGLSLLGTACTRGEAEPNTASATVAASNPQAIIDQAIAVHGGDVLHHAVVEFDFREWHFKITRDGGSYAYERTYTDSTGRVREVLNNEGIYREVNDERVVLTQEERDKMATPLNSVPYFALLPFNLNDPAVIKRSLGEIEIDGQPYHKIEVTFHQEGGGRDYDDRFVYWIHRDRLTMDYLAYGFHVDEGGTRFRKAFNVRTIGGVRFADYLNFTSDSLTTPDAPIEHFDELMRTDTLHLLSQILLENVTVRPLNGQ
ncbi:MAG: DUF6503 family protein [Rhodothermales bacterium]